jgi:RND superfamily putative drug exporter
LARNCYRHRRFVVAAWFGLVIIAVVLGAVAGGELHNEFSLPGSDSQKTADLLKRGGFIGEAGASGQIVFASQRGIGDADVRLAMQNLFASIERQVEGVHVADPYKGQGGQFAPGGTVALAPVELGDVPLDVALARAHKVASVRNGAKLPGGLQVELGGGFFYEQSKVPTEGIGLIAAMVILLGAFGSVLAMGLPIITALFGILVSGAIIRLAAHILVVPRFAPQAVALIGIGVGIDYALFLVTRYREELAGGRDPEAAVVHAVATAGRTVVFAGTTVVVALLGLLVVGVSGTRSLALAISSGVLMVMLASLTLLPALLGFVGPNIDRLSVRRRSRGRRGNDSVWYRWSRLVQRRPGPVAALGLMILLILMAPAVSMRLGFGDAGNRPASDTARRAYDLIDKGFGPGFNGPLFLAFHLATDPTVNQNVLDRVKQGLAQDPGVALATPAIVNKTGDVGMVQVFPSTSPQDKATSALVHRLRRHTLPAAVTGTGTEVRVGGVVAAGIDFSDQQASRTPLFIGLVLAVSFVVLMTVFRSIAVALKAIVVNGLSIAAAWGVVVAVFQWGWGAGPLRVGERGPIEAWAPLTLFAILFGLSMDYEVFLLSRIREEYKRTGDNSTAVADGLARTAGLITAAAAIMVFVFGSFVLSTERGLQLFGLGLAAAIIIDVTVIRLLLVPTTMELLGDRNWWLPGWLERRLPKLSIEAG